ncbi:MAG TPA: hypothetical protein VGC41_19540, partial [Kofleriaceae bacterium]
MRSAGLLVLVACQQSPPPPPPAPPPPAPVVVSPDARTERVRPDSYPELAALPDKVAGTLVRKPTAVLLLAARAGNDVEPSTELRFIPLACTIDGKLATGKACGAVMPARATIRTPEGPLVVARSTKVFHDTSGEHDYKPPDGPACCMYNTCVEVTIPYTATTKPIPSASRFGVWPADADIDLQITTLVPVQHDLRSIGARALVLLATTDL